MVRDETSRPSLGEEEPIARRRFLIVIGNTAAGVTTLGSLGVILDYLSPRLLLEIPARFSIGRLQNIQLGSVTFDPEHRVFLFREQRGYCYAVSAICTHLGCTANWKKEGIPGHPEGVIACPCHGSVFSKTGNVIRGPAPRSLDRFRINLSDDQIVVDTSVKVDEEEMILKV